MKKILHIIKTIYLRYILRVKNGKILFIPHPGFCSSNKTSIINYKADNCLVFVRYLLDNQLCKDKELVVVSTSPEQIIKEQKFCDEHYPLSNIHIIPKESRLFKKSWATAEYILSSESIFPYKKKKGQKYIVLGYYPIATKKDWFNHDMSNRLQWASQIDTVMSASLIYSQMESSAFEISFGKFLPIGRVRSDVLLANEDVSYVREYFQNLCGDYKFSKIILYPPTHRDYERSTFDIKRSILGFDVNKEKFEKFLADNKLLIVCKLHHFQNAQIVDTKLPKGVVNFTGSEKFGLIELMKASDMLMTDYSSTYVDYLLLDKPVVFNFYDIDMYEKTRGLSFYPFQRICAGDVFTDEQSFYKVVKNTWANPDKYAAKRKELVQYLHTYRTNVCEKTYQELFGDNKIDRCNINLTYYISA